MNQNHSQGLREQGFEDGAKLCAAIIHFHTAGHSSMMRVATEVPEASLLPLDEKQRRAYMQGFGEGIVSTTINE